MSPDKRQSLQQIILIPLDFDLLFDCLKGFKSKSRLQIVNLSYAALEIHPNFLPLIIHPVKAERMEFWEGLLEGG